MRCARQPSLLSLIAQRFLQTGKQIIDLATGQDVWLRKLRATTSAEEARWAEQCASIPIIQRPRTPALLDFGALSANARFEAWSVPAGFRWPTRGSRSIDRVAASLVRGSRPKVPLGQALSLQPRRAITLVTSLLEEPSTGVRRIALAGPAGSGLRPALLFIARTARLKGFVPVSATVIGRYPALLDLLPAMHVLVIDDSARGPDASRLRLLMSAAVLRFGTSSARPHLIVQAARDEANSPVVRALPRGAGSWRVHEARPDYVPDAITPPTATADGRALQIGDTGNEDARLRRGRELAGRGRHAAAERVFRQAFSVHVRRNNRDGATRAARALADLLAARCRLREARAVLNQVLTTSVSTATDLRAATSTAIACGLISVALGELSDAEAALRAAIISAEALDPPLHTRARVALGECLFWAGRFDEALGLSSPQTPGEAGIETVIRSFWVQTSIAKVRGQHGDAFRHAVAALETARSAGHPRPLAVAHGLMATLYAGLGDLQSLRPHVSAGLEAARRSHEPLLALRLRLAEIDGLERAGEKREGRVRGLRLARVWLRRLPPLLKAEVQIVLARTGVEAARLGGGESAARALIRVSGATALDRLYRKGQSMDVLHDVIELLHICQESDDEPAVLSRVCGRVREWLHASAALVCGGTADGAPICSAGAVSRRPTAVARRAMDSGLLIPPARSEEGIEAAAPVRYGGATIGALACRWPVDAMPDPMRTRALLAGAAAVCAPTLRGALDRRSAAVVSPERSHALLGVSLAIDEVRRALARAAAAPFPVLIEGTSGR